MNPLVSICIPTYQQTHLLKENLDSIVRQSYQHIEVLVSDDSFDDDVEALVKKYHGRLPIFYTRNQPSLGSPCNWNTVLQKAKGELVILLHHDDQFTESDSLATLVQPFLTAAPPDFSFGRNETIEAIANGRTVKQSYFNRYYRNPSLLVVLNALGAPSNILFRRQALEQYDERYKWIVDVEVYHRLFTKRRKFAYIDRHLIKTGRHDGQITNECIDNSEILLYENITFAVEKIEKPKSLAVFDFYWRLLRNNRVRTPDDLVKVGVAVEKLPSFIHTIISVQKKIPKTLLHTGAFSKALMALTFVIA